MIDYRIVGAYRVAVEAPLPHTHLVAIGTVREAAGENATVAWSAAELDRATGLARFIIGPPEASACVAVTRGICKVCGEAVLVSKPPEVEHSWPECRLS